jgi:hypothetical protein
MPSEDGQLTETCKGNKYLQIESHWTVLTVIILLLSKVLINGNLPNGIFMFVLIPSTFLVVTRGVVWELEGMMVT